MPTLAYLGPQGTFAEQAAHALDPAADLVSATSVTAAIDAVRAGEVDGACVPVENSVEGSVPGSGSVWESDACHSIVRPGLGEGHLLVAVCAA